MRRVEIARESWRNTVRASWLTWVTPFVVFMVLTGWASMSVTHAERTAQRLTDAGRHVLEVTAMSEDGLPRAACEALTQQPSVRASGGQYRLPVARVRLPPAHDTLPLSVVTPGALTVWTTDPGQSTAIGVELAHAKGIDTESDALVLVEDVPVRMGGALESHVPVDALQSSVVLTAWTDAPLTTCWIQYDPTRAEAARAATSVAFAGVPSSIGPYDPSLMTINSGRDEWDAFARTHAWLAGGLVLLAITIAVLGARRRDIGVYRLSGVRRADLHQMLAAQALIPVVATAPVAYAWGIAIATVVTDTPASGSAIAAPALLAACTLLVYTGGAIAVTFTAASTNVFATLREL